MIACTRKCLFQCLTCPVAVFVVIFVASAGALAAAYTSEFAWGLEPCILCLYQRVPFVITTGWGIAGLALHKNKTIATTLLALCALAFLANAGIASYHSGVERGLWESAVEGCHVPEGAEKNSTDWIDKIMETPAVPCSQIQWKDPVLGLTMANYNVLLNLALFVLCALSLALRQCPSSTEGHKPQE